MATSRFSTDVNGDRQYVPNHIHSLPCNPKGNNRQENVKDNISYVATISASFFASVVECFDIVPIGNRTAGVVITKTGIHSRRIGCL